MVRRLLLLIVAMGSSLATAQPGHPGAAAPVSIGAVGTAEANARATEHRLAQLVSQHATLTKRWKDELRTIDRLKQQRASWHHDHELESNMQSSLETANQLTATDRQLEIARAQVTAARRAYMAAIDAELAAAPNLPRRRVLERAKRLLAAQLAGAPHRIARPDLDIDLLADPEELDQRADELRGIEDELTTQLDGLTAQAARLDHLAQLRKQHDRAGDLFNRDDDQPHRNTLRQTGTTSDDPSSGPWDNPHSPASPPGSAPPSFENAVPIVLADIIDASTMSSFAAAERSGDPAQRAEAARRTRDAVARQIEQVRRKRTEIEARSRQLRVVN
jgi:hypothetical protein